MSVQAHLQWNSGQFLALGEGMMCPLSKGSGDLVNHSMSEQPICSHNASVALRGKGGTTRGQGQTQILCGEELRMASFLSKQME